MPVRGTVISSRGASNRMAGFPLGTGKVVRLCAVDCSSMSAPEAPQVPADANHVVGDGQREHAAANGVPVARAVATPARRHAKPTGKPKCRLRLVNWTALFVSFKFILLALPLGGGSLALDHWENLKAVSATSDGSSK